MKVIKFQEVSQDQDFYFYLQNLLSSDSETVLCMARRSVNPDGFNTFITGIEGGTNNGKIYYWPYIDLHDECEVMILTDEGEQK